MVICLERAGTDLYMVQLMSLPPIVSCFSRIQISFTTLVLALSGSPGQGYSMGVVVVVVINGSSNTNPKQNKQNQKTLKTIQISTL